MPKPPQHLVDLAHRAHAAGAPAHVLRGHIVGHVQREAAREDAVEHAMALVDALYETPGAPKVRLWTGLASGGAPRVYFPEGYVTVHADGSIGGASIQPGLRRQVLTFSESSLYPSQRQAYKKALDLYRAGLLERAEEQAMARAERIEELVEALGSEDDGDDEQLERQAERAAWQARHEEGRGNPRGRRAKAGGEVGMNAEFYPGGTFLPSTRLPKGERPRYSSGSGRMLVAPGQLEVAPEPGLVAIFEGIRSIIRQRPDGTVEPLPRNHPYWEHSGNDYARVADLCDRWNAGERWMPR